MNYQFSLYNSHNNHFPREFLSIFSAFRTTVRRGADAAAARAAEERWNGSTLRAGNPFGGHVGWAFFLRARVRA